MTVVLDIFGNDVEIEPELSEDDFKRKRVGLFDFMNDLNFDKRNILRENPEAEKDFQAFIINRGMSMGIDTILYANEMNANSNLDKALVYDFYIHALRPAKRYNKWAKESKDTDIELIREYYQFSLVKAQEALKILSDDELKEIKQKMNKGG